MINSCQGRGRIAEKSESEVPTENSHKEDLKHTETSHAHTVAVLRAKTLDPEKPFESHKLSNHCLPLMGLRKGPSGLQVP